MDTEPRSLVLKTQASRRLRWLLVTGTFPNGRQLRQRIDLRADNEEAGPSADLTLRPRVPVPTRSGLLRAG